MTIAKADELVATSFRHGGKTEAEATPTEHFTAPASIPSSPTVERGGVEELVQRLHDLRVIVAVGDVEVSELDETSLPARRPNDCFESKRWRSGSAAHGAAYAPQRALGRSCRGALRLWPRSA